MSRYLTDKTLIEGDPEILQKTGSGGLLSKGYLYETPLVEYLQPGEEILVLLWSDRTAPVQEGSNTTSFELGRFGALTAITRSRVLAVAGTPSGNKSTEIPIEAIQTVTTGSRGRLRPEGWLHFETSEDTLTVFDYSGLNLEDARTQILEAVASAACQQVKQTVEQAQALEQQRDLSEAKEKIEVAYEQRGQLEAFRAKHDISIQDSRIDLKTPRERIQRGLEFEELLQQADCAEDDGELSEAMQAYKEAIEVVTKSDGWIPPVDPSSHIMRLDLLRSQQKSEAAIKRAESTNGTPERYAQYRTALDMLEEYELGLSELTFDQYHDADECVVCGATDSLTNGSVADLTSEGTALDGESSQPVCNRCEVLSNAGPRWDQHDLDNRSIELAEALADLHSEITEKKYNNIDRAEKESPHPAELCVALTRAATELERPPSTAEFTDLTGYNQEPVVVAFGSWGAGLDAADLDIKAALLTEIRELVEQTGLVPIISEMYKHSRYPESVFEIPFEKPAEAIKAAGYVPPEPVHTKWRRELRSLAREHSGLPLRERAQQTKGINVSELISRYGSWEDVLVAAGILQDELQYKVGIASDIERLGETLGHTPSKKEYVEYGSFKNSEVKEAFGTFDQALSGLKLPERQVSKLDNSIDEPPDGSQEVPSHTTLLRNSIGCNSDMAHRRQDHLLSSLQSTTPNTSYFSLARSRKHLRFSTASLRVATSTSPSDI